jgi:hypothetical protein
MSENTPADAAPEATDAPEPDAEDNTAEAPELEQVEPEAAWDPKRAKEKIRKLNQEIQSTKTKLAEAPKPDDVRAKDAQISELQAATLRYEVALDLGLPKQVASRLQGQTRDEMVADAEQLLELLSPTKAPASQRPAEHLRGGGQPEREPEETDLSKLGSRIFRR